MIGFFVRTFKRNPGRLTTPFAELTLGVGGGMRPLFKSNVYEIRLLVPLWISCG